MLTFFLKSIAQSRRNVVGLVDKAYYWVLGFDIFAYLLRFLNENIVLTNTRKASFFTFKVGLFYWFRQHSSLLHSVSIKTRVRLLLLFPISNHLLKIVKTLTYQRQNFRIMMFEVLDFLLGCDFSKLLEVLLVEVYFYLLLLHLQLGLSVG